jgi:hypothetical protein
MVIKADKLIGEFHHELRYAILAAADVNYTMNTLYIIGGVLLLIYGIWQTITTAKVFMKGKQDWLGADIKILVAGIGSIMVAVYLIFKYL